MEIIRKTFYVLKLSIAERSENHQVNYFYLFFFYLFIFFLRDI